ncbi:MAG: carboxypeptidase regulatory-like domain-containing protein, partial [bacterium]|nr:carboxypeptidase regulatory-like domain-containing protein [bacterium]
QITAIKSGFVSPSPKSVSVSGGTQLEISPAITLQPNAGIILGQVTDGLRILQGAEIKATPVSGTAFNALSDEYGQFSFSLPAGTYALTAAKENHTFAENVQVTVAAGETVSSVELTLDPARAFITGKITTDGYTPLPGVEVSNSGTNTTTGDGGFYSLGLDYGTHVITALKE